MGDTREGGKPSVSLIAPVGISPPVVTEMVKWLIEGKGLFVKDVELIVTDDEDVRTSAELVVSAIECSPYKIHVDWNPLAHKDVDDEESMLDFLGLVSKLVYRQRAVRMPDKLYLCVSGGRKTESVLTTICAQLWASEGAFHVIMPDVKTFNMELERIRSLILDHHRAERMVDHYRAHQMSFDKVMFPRLEDFNVIALPILPMPPDYIDDVAHLFLRPGGMTVSESRLNLATIHLLVRHGLVQMSGTNLRPTTRGYKLGLVLGNVDEGGED